ncbi:MAG: hypothetical protein ABIH24_00910, partial [Verrucomicrobiota bacterium]
CRYCGKPIQPQARYCGFCGKSLVAPAKELGEDQKQSTIRLKPIQENSTASAKPAVIYCKPIRPKSPVNSKPAAAPPAPRPQNAGQHWYSSWGGNIRMVLSLCLLTFIGYCAYQKFKYDRDMIIPIKAAIVRTVQAGQAQSRMGLEEGAQLSYRLLWTRFMARPALPVDPPKVEPKPELEQTAFIDITATKEESSKAENNTAVESSAPVESVANTEPAATSSAPLSVPEKSPQEIELERLLAQCKQQQPKAGERVTITLNDQQKKIEVVLDHVTDEGVMAKVPPGLVEYPFRLMSAESRLMFFPEERARRLQRQQSP